MYVTRSVRPVLDAKPLTLSPDNHKPELSSSAAPNRARLKPSIPGSTESFDLSYNDQGGNYAYAGTRNADGNQYVLYFDPARQAFILDRIETTFNMNLTRLPGNSDPDHLSRRYPHLDTDKKAKQPPAKASAPKPSAPKAPAPKEKEKEKEKERERENEKPKPKPAAKPRAKSPPRAKEPKRKFEKEKKNTDVPLSFPKPAEKQEPKPRARKVEEEEEEEEDEGDGGLLIEYPGAENAPRKADFSPAFPSVRRFDEFMDQRESEGDDADGESDGEVDMDFKLPSPMNNHVPPPQPRYEPEPEPMDEDEQEEDEDPDDLEKDLENAFEDMANSEASPQDQDESEISEED